MTWLSKLFKRKKALPGELLGLEVLGSDIHSHLLPGIDDGAKNLDESIRLIEGLHSLGYKKLITTPHVMSDYYKNDSQRIKEKLTRLREAVGLHKLDVEIDAAAEYYLDEHFLDLIKKGDILSFGGKYVLFELSFFEAPKLLDQVIFELQLAGYTAVLAHPERYPYWHKDISVFRTLNDKGVLLQLNLGSLSGNYGPEVLKMAERLVDEDLISFLGSDTHHLMHIQLFSTIKTNPILQRLLRSPNLLNSSL